jgi:hypothetical protein
LEIVGNWRDFHKNYRVWKDSLCVQFPASPKEFFYFLFWILMWILPLEGEPWYWMKIERNVLDQLWSNQGKVSSFRWPSASSKTELALRKIGHVVNKDQTFKICATFRNPAHFCILVTHLFLTYWIFQKFSNKKWLIKNSWKTRKFRNSKF